MSYGTGAYGASYFGLFSPSDPALGRTKLVSSRDLKANDDYNIDTDGNYVGMDDIQQRIRLLTAFEITKPPLVGIDYESEMSKMIRKALVSLTTGPSPEVKIRSIDIRRGRFGSMEHEVKFIILATNTKTSVIL